MICLTKKARCTEMDDRRIFRAKEARELAQTDHQLVCELVRAGYVKPISAGGSNGRENLFDIGGIHSIVLYLELRNRKVPVAVAQEAARVAQSVDMWEAIKTGEHYLLVLPDGCPNQAFTRDEAKAEIAAMVDRVDIARVMCVNLVVTWGVLIERVSALIAADQSQKAGI